MVRCGTGLSPAVLADAVITKMADLPRKEDIMQEQPAGEGLRSGNALLAGLMEVGHRHRHALNSTADLLSLLGKAMGTCIYMTMSNLLPPV
jgi:hypothetical protein